MLILGIDFETTGLDTQKDSIIEVGAVLWDTQRKMPLQIYSELAWHESIWENATTTKEQIEKIVKLNEEDLKEFGKHPSVLLQNLYKLMVSPDLSFIVAHNGLAFDKPILYTNAIKWGVERPPEIPWVDTMIDIPYDPSIQTKKLTYLAAEHGFVNPFAHRAIFDVLTMLKIIQDYDMDWIYKISKEPIVTLLADTTHPKFDGGKSNEEAKARGFRWDPANRYWAKKIRASQVQTEKNAASFDIKELKEPVIEFKK